MTDRRPAPPGGAHAGDAAGQAAQASSEGAAAAKPWADPFALAARAVPGLDGLRGLACLMIFNVHFFAQFADASYFTGSGTPLHSLIHAVHSGSHGVDVFFVVSGYLIYGSLARKRPTLSRFILERYKRLLPVVLAVNIPALYWVNADWKMIVDNVFFLDLFGAKLVTFVSWALVYEMYFYLLCGVWLIVLGCGKNGPPWRSWTLLAGLYVANSLYFHVNTVLSDWRFMGFFVGIGLGMLRADPRGSKAFGKIPPGFWPVGLAVLGLGCWLWSRDFTGTLSAVSPALALAYFTAFDLAVAMLVASLVNAAQAARPSSAPGDAAGNGPGRDVPGPRSRGGGVFTCTPMRMVGAVSYSLFLLHTQWGLPLANTLFGRPASLAGLGLHYGLSLGVSFALAAFLYMHLEKFYFTRR
nr:acyltransferase [Fundidesulfovibrio terrae]